MRSAPRMVPQFSPAARRGENRVPPEVVRDAWFVVYCKRSQEASAEENLSRQGFNPYLPRVLEQGIQREVLRPLFPCYLFLHFNPFRLSMAPIARTRGVVQLVRFAGRCAVIPDAVIQELKAAENGDGVRVIDAEAAQRFRKGEQVRVTSGPFAGMVASVAENDVRIDYVVVALDWIKRIVVSRAALERA